MTRYRNLTPEEEDRLRSRLDCDRPWSDAFVDTATGVVSFARFEDDDSQPSGYRTVRWNRPLEVKP